MVLYLWLLWKSSLKQVFFKFTAWENIFVCSGKVISSTKGDIPYLVLTDFWKK